MHTHDSHASRFVGLVAALCLLAACSNSSDEDDDCSPACRSGYVCDDGDCVQSSGTSGSGTSGTCTPACRAGYSCQNGTCVENGGSGSSGSGTSGTSSGSGSGSSGSGTSGTSSGSGSGMTGPTARKLADQLVDEGVWYGAYNSAYVAPSLAWNQMEWDESQYTSYLTVEFRADGTYTYREQTNWGGSYTYASTEGSWEVSGGKFVAYDPCGHQASHAISKQGDTIYIGKIGLKSEDADFYHDKYGQQADNSVNDCAGDLSDDNPQGG